MPPQSGLIHARFRQSKSPRAGGRTHASVIAIWCRPMDSARAFDDSDKLAEALSSLIDLTLLNDSPRFRFADVACSLALEHRHAIRSLLQGALLPSALVIHRAQFEAVVRSIWLTYAASDSDVLKLTSALNMESEQAAKNVAQIQDMMQAIEKRAPAPANAALARFKTHSWKALNSYAHAGIHPLRRHAEGYPAALIDAVLCNSNGLAVLSCMQAVVLSGEQPLQRAVLDLAEKYPHCMPPPL